VGQAVASLETARRLERLPAADEAFRSGALSEAQAKEVSAAAEAVPEAEKNLVDAAQTHTVAELRQRCRRLTAAAQPDEADAYERMRAGRYVRHWSEPDGAFRLDARLTPDDGARLFGAVEARARRLVAAGRGAGRREADAAWRADALVSLAEGASTGEGSSGPAAMVEVRWTTPPWCGAMSRRARPVRSQAWVPSPWPRPGAWRQTPS
jgi:hypothetical protein